MTPIEDDVTDSTPTAGLHATLHNELAAAVNDILDTLLPAVERNSPLGDYSSLTVGSTVYAGQLVVNAGVLYERIADGTISGTFNPANWLALGGGGSGRDLGTLGAAATLDVLTVKTFVASAILSSNLVLTVPAANLRAGLQALLYFTEDGTGGHSLSITDGASAPVVYLPADHALAAAGTTFGVLLSSTTGANLIVNVLGAGPRGPAGRAGIDGTNGTNGTNGIDGTNGTNGTNGIDGSSTPGDGTVTFEKFAVGAAPRRMPPTVGEETMDAHVAVNAQTATSGTLKLTYFRALRSEAITKLLLTCGSTAAAPTPTLVRAGIYSVDTTTWLVTALLAAIASDTAIFATANSEYLRALDVTFNKVAGTYYALGQLVVTAAAAPTCPGITMASTALCLGTNGRPRKAAQVTGQTDLPGSVATPTLPNAGAHVATGLALYGLMVP